MVNNYSLDLESSSSQYASIADASQTGLDITGDMSGECWIKPESSASNTVLFQKADNNGNGGYTIILLSSNKIFVRIDQSTNGSDASEVTTTATVSDGVWTHVAFTYTASTGAIKVYINGVDQAFDSSTTNATAINNNSNPFLIGSVDAGGNYFDGKIKEVRVWSDVRTGTEIANNMEVTLVGNEANLVAYYRLENDYTDETSNGNDLTSSGSPVFSNDTPFPVRFLQKAQSATDLSEYTFSSQDFGQTHSERHLIALIEGRTQSGGAGSISSVTIGGVASTISIQSDDNGDQIGIAIAKVPTGTSGDVVVSWSGTMTDCSVSLYRALNVSSTTAYDTASSTATPTSASIDIEAGGFALAIGKNRNGSADATWTNLFEDQDTTDANGNDLSTAKKMFDTAQTALSITCDWTTESLPKLIIAAFRISAGDVTVNPSAQVATFSLPQETLSLGNTRSPSAQVSTFSVPAYAVEISDTVTPNAQVATFSIPAYAVLAGDVLATPSAQVVTLSIPAYSVLYGLTIDPNAQVVTFSVPAYLIAISETITPSAQVATFSIPAYSILRGLTTSPSVQSLTFSIPEYSVSAETAVHPSAQVATFSVPTYSLSLGTTVLPDEQVLTFTIPTLQKFGAIWQKVPRSTNATWSRTSRNSN